MGVDVDVIQGLFIVVLGVIIIIPVDELLDRHLSYMRLVLVIKEHERQYTSPNLKFCIFFDVMYNRVNQKLCLLFFTYLMLHYQRVNLIE